MATTYQRKVATSKRRGALARPQQRAEHGTTSTISAAAAAVARVSGFWGRISGKVAAERRAIFSLAPQAIEIVQCEGEDLNLHGSYPASTSTQSTDSGEISRIFGPTSAQLLATEARALLQAAAGQESVDLERLRSFARAWLELVPGGALALAVMDGGVFSPRKALELASLVLVGAEAEKSEAVS